MIKYCICFWICLSVIWLTFELIILKKAVKNEKLSVWKIEHVTTKKGLNCVQIDHHSTVVLSCNWDEWNTKTNYGQYPYAEKKMDIGRNLEIEFDDYE
jgi:hypothetical protein